MSTNLKSSQIILGSVCSDQLCFLFNSGKSTLLKALSGQLSKNGHVEGEILYNGDSVDSGNYLMGKVASYTDEKELHAATLTVRETMEFAWDMTTGGKHSYGIAKDEKTAEILDRDNDRKVKVNIVDVCSIPFLF